MKTSLYLAMDLFGILTLLLTVILFFILTPCANSQQILVNYSLQEQDHELQVGVLLPRKLIRKVIMEDANAKSKSVDTRSSTVHVHVQKQTLVTGKLHQKKKKTKRDSVHAKKGTWQELKEGINSSQFFSMDYSHVRRRRPIHNKFTPVVVVAP